MDVTKLKENLMEHYDYEVLTERLFRPFEKWYGINNIIKRPLQKDPTMINKLQLVLYSSITIFIFSYILNRRRKN